MRKKENGINILFPGRHHMLTKFQHEYLKRLVQNGVDGRKVARIIFAVTSADHENTRRNPVPLYLRTLAIDKFSKGLGCEVKIYPIKDVAITDKFASYILHQIFYQDCEELTPENTIVAYSTPSVIKLFEKLGFKNLPVELESEFPERYAALRPYEVVQLLVGAGEMWKSKSAKWREHAHASSVAVYDEYNLGSQIIEVFRDALLTDDADITETRDYQTYAEGMDHVAHIKFVDIKPFIVPGKIVDVGCSTGSLIKLLAEAFPESDIIGIEAVRRFYEYCKMQDYANPFVFFYRRNVTDQMFRENSINTFIYSSVTHEVYSYIGEKTLHDVLRHAYKQLGYGGRIIIRDVVGPNDPEAIVYMELNRENGKPEGDIKELSTYARFFHFIKDFKPRKISYEEVEIGSRKLIKLRRRDAYEFMSKMNYTDNWASEMHEEFGFYTFVRWKKVLENAGFQIVPGSHPFRNQYIIDHHYKGRASLFVLENGALVPEEYPYTNMILVGEKTQPA